MADRNQETVGDGGSAEGLILASILGVAGMACLLLWMAGGSRWLQPGTDQRDPRRRGRGIPTIWCTGGLAQRCAKGFFLSDPPRITVLELDHLRVWAPSAEYMLAMKCVSARFDTHDRGDVEFLIRHLGLTSPDEVQQVIGSYYPRERIPAKARFLVEELFE